MSRIPSVWSVIAAILVALTSRPLTTEAKDPRPNVAIYRSQTPDNRTGRARLEQGDTVPTSPDRPAIEQATLMLDELEQLALSHNPTLEQAAAGVEVERGNYQQAALYQNPQVGYVNSSSNRSSEKQSNGAFYSQEIVTSGKLRKAQHWEAQELNKISWDLDAQRKRVLTDVKIRFYEVLGAQHAVLTGKRLEGLSERGLATVRELFDAKTASRADVLQAKIQLETVRTALDEAVEREKAAWGQLVNVVGLPQLEQTFLEGSLDGELPAVDWQSSWEL